MQSSWRADWLATVIQGIPRLAVLCRHMRPTVRTDSIASLDPGTLASLGVRYIIWDVDGTLMGHHGSAVAPHLVDAFQRLCDDPNLRHVILSNCDERRFVELAAIFPTIPILRVYENDREVVVRRRLGNDDSCADRDSSSRESAAHVGAQLRTQAMRKPSVVMVRAALVELGCTSPAHAVMIGDQYLTDVAPANMLGVRTMKVQTVEPGSFPVAVRALKAAERILFRLSTWNAPV